MRILIAEDDQVLADGLLRSLRNAGYAVDQVSSGSEADAALASHEFDLVILDLGLPKLHGLEVLRKLRARGSTRAGADPHRGRQRRAARQGARPRRRRLHGQAVLAAGARGARARADAARPGHRVEPDQARPADLRRHRPRRLHQRPDDRAVGARAEPARSAAAARRAAWSARTSWSSACANGAKRSATTRSRSTSTACARRSSRARSASPPCAGWATASRRSIR